MRPFHRCRRRLYPALRREYPGHAAAARKLRPLPSGSFCKVPFFRNADPTIVFLRRALAHSYRFLQSGPRYIGTLLQYRLSLPPIPYSLHVTPNRKVCSAENSLGARDIPTSSRLYTVRPANSADRATAGIPVERNPRFIGPILETSYVVRRMLSNLCAGDKSRKGKASERERERERERTKMYFLDRSIFFSKNFVRRLPCELARICIRSRCALECRGVFQCCTLYKKWAILPRGFTSASLYRREIFRPDKAP